MADSLAYILAGIVVLFCFGLITLQIIFIKCECMVAMCASAILLGLGARFDCWPQMRVRRHATAFHNKKVFNGCANGLLFALGDALQS